MKREDLEKLLGGYAAGTLTADERRALFEAALSDQSLFEALADEEPLRDALEDPESRAQVAAALRDEPPSLFERLAAGLRVHRGWAVASATAATAVLVGAIALYRADTEKQQLALLRTPSPSAEIAPPPAPRAIDQVEKPRTKAVAAPRQFSPPATVSGGAVGGVIGGVVGGAVPPPPPPPQSMPPAALFKQKPPAPEGSSFVSSPALSGPTAGRAADGVVPPPPPPAPPPSVVATPPPPRAEAAEVVSQAPVFRVSDARALFYGPETAVTAEAVPLDRKHADTERARKQAGAMNAPVREVADLGLRYSLMRRGPDGQDSEVPLDTPLDRDEPARLRIEANQGAYLYVLSDGALLFSGPVAAHTPTLVPARPGTFDVILSHQPEVAPAGSLLSRTRPQFAATDLRKDQPVETEPADKAVYVVNTGQSPNPRVLAEFQLKYQ